MSEGPKLQSAHIVRFNRPGQKGLTQSGGGCRHGTFKEVPAPLKERKDLHPKPLSPSQLAPVSYCSLLLQWFYPYKHPISGTSILWT